MEQGIDHLVSLSPEKIPPHYAFPDLKHTLIPVEDFTGPTIAEIQKFLEICDCARRDGEVIDTLELKSVIPNVASFSYNVKTGSFNSFSDSFSDLILCMEMR